MKHAEVSPSSLHRILACPGSLDANRDRPHTTNAYSVQGTTAHALLELCLVTGADPSTYTGVVLDEGLIPIEDEMPECVNYAIDFVRAYVANNLGTVVQTEVSLAFGSQVKCADDVAFGTADIVLDNWPKEVIAIDYKHGQGVAVSVDKNPQLMAYLLGKRAERKYQRYQAVVVQPRVRGRRPVQESPKMTDAQLGKWAKGAAPVIKIALSPDAPKVTGSHCRYCAADGNCSAQYASVTASAAKEFGL